MLAKSWKKIALAICIIATLVNVTHKLVVKTNLKDELRSVLGGEAISFSEPENTETISNTANTTYAE